MDNLTFNDILMSNDEESMKRFLTANGKVKPHSAVYFVPKGELKDGRRESNSKEVNEGDQRSNS